MKAAAIKLIRLRGYVQQGVGKMEKKSLARFTSRRQLELYILPTEECNFRCTYCYEDFALSQMKENTVAAIKKLILARLPSLQRFDISWFGGEPLMAKGVVFELNEFAQRECAAAGVTFRSNMTTNGYGMDRATFDRLVALDVRSFQISLDGDEEQHNNTRRLMSGRGSFQKIWGNLLGMRASSEPFEILLRLHIHKQNIDSIKTLLGKIAENFGHDTRFTIFMKAVGNWGGDSVKSMALLRDSSRIIDEFQQLLVGHHWYANRVRDTAGEGVSPCYAARPNSFVIRADGSLAKCTVAFNDPRNRVGKINDDGTLLIDNEKIRSFMRGFQNLDEDELNCPMANMPKLGEYKVIQFQKQEPSAVA
jgi:uncharacterized protein